MVRINVFDRVLKILARNYAALFLRLAFPDEPLQLAGTLENVELSLPEERVDFVHRVVYHDEELIFHLEFQLQHRPDFPKRQFIYPAALTKQFQRPVITLALYLERRESPIPNEYVVRLGKRVVNRFTYPLLKLWDYEEAIRAGQFRELAPLLIVLAGRADEGVLVRERERSFCGDFSARRWSKCVTLRLLRIGLKRASSRASNRASNRASSKGVRKV